MLRTTTERENELNVRAHEKTIKLTSKHTRKTVFRLFCFVTVVVAVACFIGLLTNNLGFGFFFASLTLLSGILFYLVMKWRGQHSDVFCFMKHSIQTNREITVDQNRIYMLIEGGHRDIHEERVCPLRPLNFHRSNVLAQSDGAFFHCINNYPSTMNSLRGGVYSDTNLFIRSPPPYSTIDNSLPPYELTEQMNRAQSENAMQCTGRFKHS